MLLTVEVSQCGRQRSMCVIVVHNALDTKTAVVEHRVVLTLRNMIGISQIRMKGTCR